jgi:hypothetical protein
MSYYILIATGNPEEFVFSGKNISRIKRSFVKLFLIVNEIENDVYDIEVRGRKNTQKYSIESNSVISATEIFMETYVSCELVE